MFEQLQNTIKNLIESLQDNAARFAKLFQCRDLIWFPLSKCEDYYSTIPELNYFVIEGFFLLLEVLLSIVVIAKVFICHNNSKKWMTLLQRNILPHAKNKLRMVAQIFRNY